MNVRNIYATIERLLYELKFRRHEERKRENGFLDVSIRGGEAIDAFEKNTVNVKINYHKNLMSFCFVCFTKNVSCFIIIKKY